VEHGTDIETKANMIHLRDKEVELSEGVLWKKKWQTNFVS
jgi:hypothetical protein